MSMLPNEEQTILKHAAHEFFRARMPVASLRRLRDEREGAGFDPALWREMAAMGWAGILIPEAYGGSDFGYKGLGLLLEEAGRNLAASPLLSTALVAAPLILAAGSEAQKREILGAIAAGERIVALALDEGPRHAPAHHTLRADKRGDGYVLSGTKAFVLDGAAADQIVVVARTEGGPDDVHGLSLFVLDAQVPGVQRQRRHLVDGRNCADIRFDGVELSERALLGRANEGYALLEPVLDGARACLAAEMLGSGLEAFERTLAYLKLRTQFGVPIGSFQALKHRAAEMFCEIELTRSAVLEALSALDARREDVAELASLAKAKACDMLELVSNEAIQMHGGIGMTDEEEIGFFLKRARVAQLTFGDAHFHRERYATLAGF